MKYQSYGNSGVRVSVIGLGTGELGSVDISDAQAFDVLDTAFSQGITLFDTARSYGLSEERLGRWVRDKRAHVVLSTKVGYGVEGIADWTYDAVAFGIDNALRRLQTDYIDIVHLHSCGEDLLRRGDVVAALLQAREQGKIRCAAYSGENEALDCALNLGVFDGIQCSVNILDQHNNLDILPRLSNGKVGVLAKRSLANAVWRFATEPVRDDHREYWRRWRAMDGDGRLDWTQAFRFAVFTEGISSALCATSKPSRIHEWMACWQQGSLSEEEQSFWTHRYETVGRHWPGLI